MRQTSFHLATLVWLIIDAGCRHIHTRESPTFTATTMDSKDDDLSIALGEFGLDLKNTDLNSVLQHKKPDYISFRGKDIQEHHSLQHSVVKYLLQYGYLETVKQKTEKELGDTVIEEGDLSAALKRYQTLFSLEVTGTVTEETLVKMREARCGIKDEEFIASTSRVKRYTVKRKLWKKKRLFYWFDPKKYSGKMPKATQRQVLEKSMELWAKVAGVTFIELPANRGRRADIKISFERGSHGDKYPFDGSGGIVAHAFFPRKGLLHFDDSEDFTTETTNGINLHFIATHELGHILGIDHTFHEDAIMFPLYSRVYPDKIELADDDKSAARVAMGGGVGRVVPLRKWS
ncbi:matrilysin-like [Bolinopsis microptera]|uniref:matrilysin-like n=1 Tax=Bolinopsis microptera TaxID=2820187 RepID=UPI00307A5F95